MVAEKVEQMRQGQRTDLSQIQEKSQKDAAILLNIGKE
jgi:hypothetical protein